MITGILDRSLCSADGCEEKATLGFRDKKKGSMLRNKFCKIHGNEIKDAFKHFEMVKL